jgi:hypothetical protein
LVGDIADRITQLLLGNCALPDRTACRNYAVQNYDWDNIAQQVRGCLLAPRA